MDEGEEIDVNPVVQHGQVVRTSTPVVHAVDPSMIQDQVINTTQQLHCSLCATRKMDTRCYNIACFVLFFFLVGHSNMVAYGRVRS